MFCSFDNYSFHWEHRRVGTGFKQAVFKSNFILKSLIDITVCHVTIANYNLYPLEEKSRNSLGFLLGMPDQAKEFSTLKRFVVDARNRTNVYLKKINKNLNIMYHLWNSECSLLSLEESLHLILTQLPVNTATIVKVIFSGAGSGEFWSINTKDHQLHSRDQRASLGMTTKMPCSCRLWPGRKVFLRMWFCH